MARRATADGIFVAGCYDLSGGMGDRQIPWQRVAERFAGDFRAATGIRTSRFRLRAVINGTPIDVCGDSLPYSMAGGTTEIRAFAWGPLDVVVHLARDAGPLPLWRRFFLRDVEIGDAGFDAPWVINARREAHAQAFLGPKVRALVQAVPPATHAAPYGGEIVATYYDFDMRGSDVLARTPNFEMDEERLTAAIEAAAALAEQPKRLLSSWQKLASALDGRLEVNKRWRMDGSTRIRFPAYGSRVTVSPRIVNLGRRRDRLRTRVYCDRSGERRGQSFRIAAEQSTAELGEAAKRVEIAMGDSCAVLVEGDSKSVYADLDGNVTDARRIMAAASAVAILARGKEAHAGPYR